MLGFFGIDHCLECLEQMERSVQEHMFLPQNAGPRGHLPRQELEL